MNGASADPWANTSKRPTSSMTMMSGRSQSFFLTRMKAQNSRARLERATTEVSEWGRWYRLELALQRARGRLRPIGPKSRSSRLMDQRISAAGTPNESGRREKEKIDQ